MDLMLATYNNGSDLDRRVANDWRMLLLTLPDGRPVILGTEETGDRSGVAAEVDRLPDVQVLRARHGTAAARLALAVAGGLQDTITPDLWGYWPLNPGQEPVEKTVKGNRDGTAEPKFVEWVNIQDTLIGVTHLIPSTGIKTITGKWKHPLARDIYALQVARIVAWFAQGGDVCMGDFNGPPDHPLLAPLREVATCHHVASRGDAHIDHIWVRNGSGLTLRDVRALDGFSSDHRPVIGTLTIPDPPTLVPPQERAARLIENAAKPVLRPKVKELMLRAAADLRSTP